MKALSIRQPWADLIGHGLKTCEIRSWQTHYRGDLLICSSARPDNFMREIKAKSDPARGAYLLNSDPRLEGYYQLGFALYIVELYDITQFTPALQEAAMCDFSPGLFAWHVRNVRKIKPFKVKGQLGLFNIEIHSSTNLPTD